MGPKVTREFCEDKYLINTRVEYKMSTLNWTPGRPLGDGCYAVDFDSSKTFYEQSTFQVAFNSSDPSDALVVQVVSLTELENRKRFGFATLSRFEKTFSRGVHSISLTKTSVTNRLQRPYKSNCSKESDTFSKVQTRASCKESCVFNKIYEKCGDVPDGWSKQFEEQGLASRKMEFNVTKRCLLSELEELEREGLMDCICQDPCEEVVFSWSHGMRSKLNYWGIVYHVKPSEVMYSRQIPDYTIEDYLGGVGGILGIGLGISVASMMELLVYFMIIVIGKLRSCF